MQQSKEDCLFSCECRLILKPNVITESGRFTSSELLDQMDVWKAYKKVRFVTFSASVIVRSYIYCHCPKK